MSNPHSHCSLYLYPERITPANETLADIIALLHQIGFIIKKLDDEHQQQRYSTGDKYLDYIAYMGCSPAIDFETGTNKENFCSIKVHQYQNAQLIHSKIQLKPPQCSSCNKIIKNWQQNKTRTTLYCENCNSTVNIESINWRKMAGFSQLFIAITDIFPKEALPQPLLLEKLKALSKTEWRYFYSCQ